MGLFDFLTSTKKPKGDTPVLSAQEVRQAVLNVNRPTAPYQIMDGGEEGVDLIAEWKIVDAKWYEIFAKAGLKQVFRIYLKLDEANHQVRASDREYKVAWKAGVPSLSLAASAFKGQKQSVEFGAAYAFTEELEFGEVYKYRFSTKEIKTPIQQAATDSGWTYKGIAFGKL